MFEIGSVKTTLILEKINLNTARAKMAEPSVLLNQYRIEFNPPIGPSATNEGLFEYIQSVKLQSPSKGCPNIS